MEKELSLYFANNKFVQETIEQLNKDLIGLSELEHSIQYNSSAENQLKNISVQLEKVLGILHDSGNQKLAQFVYRVDLKESEFRYFLTDERIERLSLKIIEREALKVFIRWKYSTNKTW